MSARTVAIHRITTMRASAAEPVYMPAMLLVLIQSTT